MAMTFGMHLGHVGGPMAEMRNLWRFADANGFDWFSSADHFGLRHQASGVRSATNG